MQTLSRAGFLKMGASLLLGALGFGWLLNQPKLGGVPWPLRKMLEFNEGLNKAYFRPDRLAPTFPAALARTPRVNGEVGMDEAIDPARWQLQVSGLAGSSLSLGLDELKRLPHHEIVTELKCIEGWSEIVHWGGIRFQDFVARYYPELARDPSAVPYVAFETPEGTYYVGIDTPSALHPQTLLCYEMNGQALSLDHGAPLRLVIPVKYGYKWLKRIGTIRFSRSRPADYWAERGYDWHAGH